LWFFDSRSFMKVTSSVSIATPSLRSRSRPSTPSRDPVRLSIESRLPATCARGSPIPPTLQILLPLSLSFGIFKDPGILNQAMSIRIFACHFGSRLLPLYNALVVRFSTPTLFFCFACFAASCHSARCSVNRRLLSRFLSDLLPLRSHTL